MKKKMFTMAVVAICLSLLGYGTLAYFTAEDTAHNVITSGQIKVELLELADEAKKEPFPEDGVSGVMPGTGVTKIVEVKNIGSHPAYIRVMVDKAIILPEGVDGEPDPGLMLLDFDDTCWTLGEDGFYYYNEALDPGEVTKPLFASVRFAVDMGNIYQNSTATVDVFVYAVQTANNGDTVFDAAGWPEN